MYDPSFHEKGVWSVLEYILKYIFKNTPNQEIHKMQCNFHIMNANVLALMLSQLQPCLFLWFSGPISVFLCLAKFVVCWCINGFKVSCRMRVSSATVVSHACLSQAEGGWDIRRKWLWDPCTTLLQGVWRLQWGPQEGSVSAWQCRSDWQLWMTKAAGGHIYTYICIYIYI